MAKTNPNLIIAKMDATANDIHPIFGEIKGYPTLFFLPVAHKQQPVQYEGGEFSYKSLKAFVDQQSSVFLTDEERMGLPSPKPKSDDTQSSDSTETHPSEQRKFDEL